MNETIKTIKLNFDLTNEKDRELIQFVQKLQESQKSLKIGKGLDEAEMIKLHLSRPTKKTREDIKLAYMKSLTIEDKFKALYEGFKKIESEDQISQAEFSMNHLQKISSRRQAQIIKEYIS